MCPACARFNSDAPRDDDGNLVLNMNTMWRSRDLYKAWPDNIIGLTFLQRVLASQIAEKAERPVRVGSYADYSASLHDLRPGLRSQWAATPNAACRAFSTPSTRRRI